MNLLQSFSGGFPFQVVGGILLLFSTSAFSQEEAFLSQPIGKPNNGCIKNAVALSPQGEGYTWIRPSRQRNFGHPSLIIYLTELAKKAQGLWQGFQLRSTATEQTETEWVLGIGDLSAAWGGPVKPHHSSHQEGLDVDVPYLPFAKMQDPLERENVTWISVVDWKQHQVNDFWNPQIAELIHLAASAKQVARVFVNPVVKEKLCQMSWQDRSWLRKVSPESRHTDHMHVRLHCPSREEGGELCQEIGNPSKDEGCDPQIFQAWYQPPRAPKKPDERPRKEEPPPLECQVLFASQQGMVQQAQQINSNP